MEIKRITGTRSYIDIEIDDKKVTIPGELTSTPAFYAELNSEWVWKDGDNNTLVTENEKIKITHLTQQYKQIHSNGFLIIFD